MALADNRLFVPWVDLPTRARSTGLPGGLAGQSPNFRKGRGGLTAVSPATGRVLWQRKLPSLDFGAATVANDVVFTSTYAGAVYAFDTRTGKTLWTTKAPAGINAFPAIDGDTLLVGAGAPGFQKKPRFELIAYGLPEPASAGSEASQARASATTDRVSAKEFSFKLATRSVAKPGRVTFTLRNVGHVGHNFHILGKGTPTIGPGKTARLVVPFRKRGRFRYVCTVPGHAAAGMRGVFTVR
jgi:plastocyanin